MITKQNFFAAIPPVTKNLIIINFLVWVAMMILPSRLGVDIEAWAGLHYFGASDFNVAQLFTYMFMHSTQSLAHLFFNMFTLLMFGIALERTLGSARFLFYYISCGVGAALVQELMWALTWQHTLLHAFANINNIDFETAAQVLDVNRQLRGQVLNNLITIGASGAVYGILLAFGMIFPNRPLYMLFVPVPIKAKWMVIGYGVIELLIGMSSSIGASDGVAHFAHLGGMLFGFIMIFIWKKNGTIHGSQY